MCIRDRCQDITVTLDENGMATIAPPDVVSNFLPGDGYTIDQTGEFNPASISGTPISLGDDQVSNFLNIGFDFVFYGETYSQLRVSSNGFITFSDNGNSGCCSGQALPNTATPNNLIAFAWDDLFPPGGNGSIEYTTIGTAPQRIFVLDVVDIAFCCNDNAQVTTQVKLFEGSSKIEIHSTSVNGSPMTQGIENLSGTEALVVPGRNSEAFTIANDYVAFIPNTGGFPDTCGNETTVTIDIDAFTCDDLGENTVVATATDSEGNISMCTSVVTVISNLNVTFELDQVFCEDQDAQTGLGGGLPIGGVYSGTGVTDDGNGETFTFDPSVAGVGVNDITYTATNSCTAEGSATVTVEILSAIPELVCEDVEIALNEDGELTIGPELILSGSDIEGAMPGDGLLYAVNPFGNGNNDIARYIYNPVSGTISVDTNYSYSTNTVSYTHLTLPTILRV